MKKICLIAFDMSVCGGAESVTANLANALTNYFEVHLISLILPEGKDCYYHLDQRIKFSSVFSGRDRFLRMQRRIGRYLREYFRKNHISIAFCEGQYAGYLCAFAGRFVDTKTVFVDHGALINQWNDKYIRYVRFVAAHCADYVVALTERTRNDYCRLFHLRKKKVKCIYNWIDLEQSHSEEYNVSSKRIISVGRISREKGFDLLVQIFKIVIQRYPDWHLDIFGDGDEFEHVNKQIEVLGCRDNVHLKGHVNDLQDRYGNYAMYVLPSYREGMPLVLLEAKLNRLPIISFDITTGPREIVQDEVDGILVKPYELDNFADAIMRLIEEPELRMKMSCASQDNLEKFSKKTILGQWIELIEAATN